MVSAEGPDLPRSALGLGPEGGCVGDAPRPRWLSLAPQPDCFRQVGGLLGWGLGAGLRTSWAHPHVTLHQK